MPDVKEVYEMVTKQKLSDPGALERQRTRQVRTMRNRKIGAFAVAAAIGAVVVVVILASLDGQGTTGRTIGTDPEPTAMEVATDFIQAFGALDADRTVAYLADDANVSSVIGWLGAQGDEGPLEEFRLLFSLLEAQGYTQTIDSCEEVGSSDSVTTLRCTYDFHTFGSDEIGRGPFSGSSFDLIVRDGEIAHAVVTMEIEEFGPQMWDPFADWVATNHPEDVAVMYEDETQSLERVTEASIRLWGRHVRGYVRHVLETQGPS
jgi:hypothetical protein